MNANSVYDLLSKLCEKFSVLQGNPPSSKESVLRNRKKCFEIVLSGRRDTENFPELENNKDPVSHLLAWEYILSTEYNLPEHASKIKNCLEKLQSLGAFNDDACNNVIMLLLKLKSVPTNPDSIMEKVLNKDINKGKFGNLRFPYFDEDKFHLPENELLQGVSNFENKIFKISNQKIVFRTMGMKNQKEFLRSRSIPSMKSREKPNIVEAETQESSNIWEVAASKPLGKHRTWEEHGRSNTTKQLPFLSELAIEHTTLMVKLFSKPNNCPGTKTVVKRLNVISSERLVKDIKYLLVGIQTKSFCLNNGEYELKQGTCIESLSYGAVRSYCKDFIFGAQCYTGLDVLCSQNSLTLKGCHNGYLFFELCESIKRYLINYRLAILSIPNTVKLLSLQEHTKQLRNYIMVLSNICKVGPYKESTQIPHGVALLNYLFQQVMCLTDTNIILALYTVLYPCCQVYFRRFLLPWMLHGSIHDPFGEFFINVNPKYITTRGRTYWTRSYTVREDIVPSFIGNLSSEILACGKAMNLLKLCVPNSPLCLYIMEKQPDIMTCCLTPEQLLAQEQFNYTYYLEASAVCGPKLSLSQIITSCKEEDCVQLNLIAKKRLATLRRIEYERKLEVEKEYEKRNQQMKVLQEEYLEAIRLKQIKRAEELEENLKVTDKNIWIQNLHDKIVAEESANLINYYNKLYDSCEQRRTYFEQRSKSLRKLLLQNNASKPLEIDNYTEKSGTSENSESFVSLHEETVETNSDYVLANSQSSSSSTLSDCNEVIENPSDINANSAGETEASSEVTEFGRRIAAENFEVAKRNKEKVTFVEMNVGPNENPVEPVVYPDKPTLTEAQRNKLKVMSSEFDIDVTKLTTKFNLNVPLTISAVNRNKMMASSDCFLGTNLKDKERQTIAVTWDNEDFVNKNVEASNIVNEDSDGNKNVIKKWVNTKQDKLSLELGKIENRSDTALLRAKTEGKLLKSPKFELSKISPMSIDSTPISSSVTTPLSKVFFEKNDIDTRSLSETQTASDLTVNDQGFVFELYKTETLKDFESRTSMYDLKDKSDYQNSAKGVFTKDMNSLSNNCIKLHLEESILLPLTTQTKLVTNELLKFFIQDQMYLKHLKSLRNYFFLLDGEFARDITDNLFKKLYDVNFPMDLINIHTLTVLVYKAIDYSTQLQDFSQCLSFRVNDLPQVFDLGNPDVFDCISLTYKTSWPLNILLPSDSISKYDEVFQFLLKLHRISWVLQNIFQDLKSLLKETELKKTAVMSSPQYRRLHQYRHVMTHFIQTLQTYIVSEVLHSSWEIFENHLKTVTTINQLYVLHTTYIKNILFMCLLNQKSTPLQKVLNKIFIVILKFYDYLRSRSWYSVDGVFMHPNFKKLEDIFSNFQELMFFLFKIGHKVVRSGYQPHLLQLLDMLNINDYYTKTE